MESGRRSFSRASDRLASIEDAFPYNEVAEPDRFAVAREENYTDALLPPRALVLRRDRYDFLAAAPLVIARIEARPRVGLIEILRIEAKHTEQFCEERNRSSYFLPSFRDKNRQRSETGNYRFV
jgi:hypothetical protein